jgi:ubiquinone/menaquinone biosynthesis C-methylase UbiE
MPIDTDFVTYFTQVQASEGWDRILASFARFLALDRSACGLDVGCGPGSLVRRLAHAAAFAQGCDADHYMIEQARCLAQKEGLTNVEYRVGVLPKLPYAADTFDVVTATNVIFLQRDPLTALRGLAHVCKPNGMVAMLNPSPQMNVVAATALADQQGLIDFSRTSFINWANVAEQNHRFSAERITQMFETIGLSDIAIESKISGLALFAKARKRDGGKER